MKFNAKSNKGGDRQKGFPRVEKLGNYQLIESEE